jgi:hypothetical protein
MFLQLKSGHDGDGPAWIGRVSFSKTGRTIYYGGRTLRPKGAAGESGDYVDDATGEEFWISGIKRNLRPELGRVGQVHIDDDAAAEYERRISR